MSVDLSRLSVMRQGGGAINMGLDDIKGSGTCSVVRHERLRQRQQRLCWQCGEAAGRRNRTAVRQPAAAGRARALYAALRVKIVTPVKIVTSIVCENHPTR
jgi:hypothetical protein